MMSVENSRRSDVVQVDLSEFGYRELEEASRLLLAYIGNEKGVLGDGVQLAFNRSSGYVFLVDEDYRVALMNGHHLEEFYSCGECGFEGFAEEWNATTPDKAGEFHRIDDDGQHHFNGPELFCVLCSEVHDA